MQDEMANDQENQEPSRRRFLKAAAGAGVAGAVWSEPLIRGIPAYAADASSVVGSRPNTFIYWSPNRDNWDGLGMSDAPLGPGITQSPNLAMNVCGTSASYSVLLDSGAVISLTAFGNPDTAGTGDSNDRECTGAGSGTSPALISLEPQTGCMFSGVSALEGVTTVINNGTQIQYTNNADGGLRTINFSITCG